MVEYVYLEQEDKPTEEPEIEILPERRAKEKNKIDWRVAIASIAGLVMLESIALLTGHNGILLRLILMAIAGLGGAVMPQVTFKRNRQ